VLIHDRLGSCEALLVVVTEFHGDF
jgi:hypothetical protein